MLKLIAALLMVLDHFAIIFLSPTSQLYLWFRVLGRLSMPIFAYKIAVGFQYTRHFKQYLFKLLLMTLAAQIPFSMLYLGDNFLTEVRITNGMAIFENWNIGLTFLCSLLILYYLKPLFAKEGMSFGGILMVMFLTLIAQFGDYGIYGVLNVIVFYTFIRYKYSYTQCALFLLGINLLNSYIFWYDMASAMFMTQLPSLFSLMLIQYVEDSRTKLGRHFFYYFYPLHLIMLFVIKALI